MSWYDGTSRQQPKRMAWRGVRETADEWLERIGYCFHRPLCTDSAACRLRRAKERGAQPARATVYTGEGPPATDTLLWPEEEP